jgi:hypothetical protein
VSPSVDDEPNECLRIVFRVLALFEARRLVMDFLGKPHPICLRCKSADFWRSNLHQGDRVVCVLDLWDGPSGHSDVFGSEAIRYAVDIRAKVIAGPLCLSHRGRITGLYVGNKSLKSIELALFD